MAGLSRNGRKDTEVYETIEGSVAHPTEIVPVSKDRYAPCRI